MREAENMIVAADTDGMRCVADEMRQIADTIKKLNYLIEQLVFSTCDDWQGAAERAFAESVITVNEGFAELLSYVKEYSELLNRFASEYEDMDTIVSKKVRGI